MRKHLLILLFLISGITHAQIIVTDRPSQTDNSSTLTKGRFQVEGGLLAEKIDDDTALFTNYLAPTVLFHYGITERVEIRVIEQFESNKFNGLADLQLGTKIQVWKKEGSKLEFAFLTHVSLPTGTDKISSDSVWAIHKLAGSWKLNEKLALGYTFGYYYGNILSGQISYSLLLGWSLTNNISVFAETYGNSNEASSPPSINADAGLAYLIKNNLQADLYFGTGINNQMTFLSVGLSWFLMKN